jgi:6-pyruvoyltetrahydropterin/6-carboxytetrahydropterin synthase
MVTVTKRFEFCYGHNLPGYIGKCRNSHGHNAILEVEVAGPPMLESAQWKDPNMNYVGMVVDFGVLKAVVKSEVLDELDHSWLNDVPALGNPTAENLVDWIWVQLKRVFQGNLVRVRLYETPDSYAEKKD